MKRAEIRITKMTNESAGFYELIGPFLGSRDVHRDLGGPLFDDPGKIWFVARRGRRLVGFCALAEEGSHAVLKSAYVLPDERGQQIYDALFRARLAYAEELGLPMRSVVTSAAIGTFRRYGFKSDPSARPMKKYTTMVRS